MISSPVFAAPKLVLLAIKSLLFVAILGANAAAQAPVQPPQQPAGKDLTPTRLPGYDKAAARQ